MRAAQVLRKAAAVRLSGTLRSRMLAILLPGMLAVIGAELWLTRADAVDAANAAFDRSLLGAIKSVEANVSTASGGLAVELPYRLFEFFQLTAHGNVYFRVATADGLVEIGSPDLPQPDEPLALDKPVFYDALYLGEAVRVGSYSRKLDKPLGPGGVQQLVIQVAESVESRRAFSRSFVLRTALRDALVISLIGITLALMFSRLLRPISRLAAQVRARQPSDLRPLEAPELPSDIEPLVHAVNQQFERVKGLMERQQNFIDDASHQLRTPLATLHAQVGYALRSSEPTEMAATLQSINQQLELATRSTNQLLALARSDAAALSPERFDLGELLRELGRRLLPLARARSLDFGIDEPTQPCACEGDRNLLMEAASNLAHNAVAYTPVGGQVTLAALCDEAGYSLQVTNAGEAIAADITQRMGTRFLKGRGSSGAGLGLAIAKAIIERHGGWLKLERLESAGMNRAWLWWPAAARQDEERR